MSLRAALAASLALTACTTEDTGKLCDDPNMSFPAEPVTGENTIIDVVNLYRNAKCETFQCLQHNGLHAYCTRSCTYNPVPKNAKACTNDGDCSSPLHCNGNVCNDDDCPAGFWCRTVQDVGPLAGQQFCVRHDNCRSTVDCDDAASMTCSYVGCFDSCLRDPAHCSYHAKACESISKDMACTCDGQAYNPNPAGDPKSVVCADQELTCQPPDAVQAFPAGAVTQKTVCMPL
jgi:hypothetical protein